MLVKVKVSKDSIFNFVVKFYTFKINLEYDMMFLKEIANFCKYKSSIPKLALITQSVIRTITLSNL